ncbi:hypothetical protein JKF63_02296 [Porcisia hertigi]|uniref:THIF-type NAD/FAD binding fold domain-containing protein n=1 Tax=Porcisia hertigi TaxID=2761500 RepID=A0A836HLA9_9TRYP|nr:hypothetical protein JKF63_02296 [Porcisia hertigi]
MSTWDNRPLVEAKHIIGGNLKEAKFDRQLRLWGADGQAALEAAHVVALGATLAITEALKSLVLTGVRTFTLVDERFVCGEDVATNYFVSPTDVGAPLAAVVLRHVCALGEQCDAVAVQESPRHWVAKYTAAVDEDWATGCVYSDRRGPGPAETGAQDEPTVPVSAVMRFLAGYTPLAKMESFASADAPPGDTPHPSSSTNAPPSLPSLFLVSERYVDLTSTSPFLQVCAMRVQPDVPVLLIRSSGFLGMLQTYSCDRVVMCPQNPTQVKMEDLRVFEPFPALQTWFDAHHPDDLVQFPVDSADAMTPHSHLPYPCIVHHAFRRWRAAMPDNGLKCRQGTSPSVFPLTTQDYRDIASIIAGMIRRQSPPEEAFLEAMEKCTAKLNRPVVQQLPQALVDLFGDARCADPMRAVRAVRSRISPAAFTSPSPAVRKTAELLVWGCPDVLVWFILRAVQLFVMGKIGGELELCNVPLTTPPVAHNTGTGEEVVVPDVQGGTAHTGTPPFRPTYSAYHMPYSGHLPDFMTTTTWYRELQDVYQAKHADDVTCIWVKACELLEAALLQEDDDARVGGSSEEEEEEEETQGRGPWVASLIAEKAKALLRKHTATVVENIWDIRGVTFSPAYRAATETEWRQRLGQRLVWLTRHISFDVEWNPTARRATCLAVAYLTKEELHRQDRCSSSGVSASAIAQEAAVLMSQEHRLKASMLSGESEEVTFHSFDESCAPWWFEEDSRKLFVRACEEVARWDRGTGSNGACVQLPSVAASTGALAAQEAVKLLMRMRVPCASQMLYDGYTNKVFML